MSEKLSARNVQAIVPQEVHRVLRETAYEHGITLKELIRDVLVRFVSDESKTSQLKRTLSVP